MRRVLQAHIDSVVFIAKSYLEWTLQFPNAPFRLCEIGVCIAGNAARALSMCQTLDYTGIDPWEVNDHYLAGIRHNVKRISGRDALRHQQRWDELYQDAQNNIAFAGERARLVRARSPEVAASFPDNHFTLVYIDGDHSFNAVTEDMKAWYRKVVPGGWFAGDDYLPRKFGRTVCRAVDQWFADHKMTLEMSGLQTWWCQKPIL